VNGFSNWRDRLPLPVFFALVFVVWTGIQLLFHLGDHSGRFEPQLIGDIVGGLIFAAILTAMFAWRRRRAGGATELAAMNRAVRTGELPEEAEPGPWDAELARRERLFTRQRWLSPLIFGLFAVVAIALLVTGGAGIGVSIVLLAAFLFLTVYSAFTSVRFLARVRSLRAQLRVGTPASGTGPGTGHL
jgi:hypothetical protein